MSQEGASWSYSTSQQYVIDLQLQDGQGATTDTGYFLLYVTKNDPPKFTNLGSKLFYIAHTAFVKMD